MTWPEPEYDRRFPESPLVYRKGEHYLLPTVGGFMIGERDVIAHLLERIGVPEAEIDLAFRRSHEREVAQWN